jgi:uncharacterized protein (DUF3820 family)
MINTAKRTRIEARIPVPTGRVHGAVMMDPTGEKVGSAEWFGASGFGRGRIGRRSGNGSGSGSGSGSGGGGSGGGSGRLDG